MADDIDIEEHDVMESLRQRQLDAVVKTEPMDMEDSDLQYESSDGYLQWEWESHRTDTPQIKVETPEDAQEFHFGKIILGSKPSQDSQVDQTKSSHTDYRDYNFNMSLVLEDWGPMLQKSNCYCHDCETLFATVNALDAHKMIAHSFLIATDKEASPERNKAVKSTARHDGPAVCEICNVQFQGRNGVYNLNRHYKNVHNVDPLDVEARKGLKDWKICNHCNHSFPSDTALVKHLYALLPLNDNKTPVKEEKRSPVKVLSPVKYNTSVNDYLKVTPITKTYEKKRMQSVSTVPSGSSDVKNVKVKNTTIVKDVQPLKVKNTTSVKDVQPLKVKNTTIVKDAQPLKTVLKQTNSIILGSKVNNVNLQDVKKEPEAVKSKQVRKCEICGIEYSFKYYILHMRKFHKDFLKSRLDKLQTERVAYADRYKCKLCNKILTGKVDAKRHRAIKHPGVGNKRILVKLFNKIAKPQPKVVVKQDPVEEKTDLVVSKSTLFKCNRCSSHFLTCYGACAHSRVCETSSNLRLWSCPQCQRVFKNVDKKAHEFQHKVSNAEFKVYVVYLEMVVRILCQCPFCNVCFEEYKFWRHVNFGCDGDAQSIHCEKCQLPIDATSETSHASKHTHGDFTKEDFIKIDFASSSKELGDGKIEVEIEIPRQIPTPTLKRKLPAPEPEFKVVEKKPKRVISNRDEFLLYYCNLCKCYMTRKARFHSVGKCKLTAKGYSPVKRNYCTLCCLTFTVKTYETHKKLHKKYPNMTLLDLQFKRLADDKKMKPHPEYYPCKSCHVNFACLPHKTLHTCNASKSFNCPVCQKKIEKAAQKAHMRFHNYGIAKSALKPQSPSKSSNQSFSQALQAPSTSKELPELLMKYQSLTTLWNILHLCITCGTFTDSYDKVVEHCQNHVTNMENYGVVIMKCQICNMKFDSGCYRRHLELHSGSGDIARKSFKILKYDHTKLFAKNWLSYLDLPEDRKSQILKRSIYGGNTTIKMKLVQQGPPEYTVYRCAQCQKCVGATELAHHIALNKKCLKANKRGCSYCSLIFSTKQSCEEHETIHQTAKLTAQSFRIVEFNDPNHEEFYKKVTPENVDPSFVVNAVEVASVPASTVEFGEENVKVIKGQKFYMFFKCALCGVCTHTQKLASKHICTDSIKKICPKCNLIFIMRAIHDRLHERYDFSEKNVFTKTFNNSLEQTEETEPEPKSAKCLKLPAASLNSVTKNEEAKLYKCHCGLHYTSLQTIEKHYQANNCSSVVKEQCSQCNLIFDANEIVNHLCKHHAQTRISKFEIVTPVKKTLYKCNKCHALLLSRNTAGTHSTKCDGKTGVKCQHCGLSFHHTCIEAHRKEHREGGMLKPDCYIVMNLPKTQPYTNILYKCKKCNVHFLQMRSLRKHVVEYGHFTSKITECKICCLRFSRMTVSIHVKYHHNLLKIDKFRFKYFGSEDDGKDEITPNKSLLRDLLNNDGSSSEARKEKERVFKCQKCDLNFTNLSTLRTHNDDRCSKELMETCEECDRKFSARDIKDHMKSVHGISVHLKGEEAPPKKDVDYLRESDKCLLRCTNCNLHYNHMRTMERHHELKCVIKRPCTKCEECDAAFLNHSFYRHQSLHKKFKLKKSDFVIVDVEPPTSKVGKIHDASATDEVQSQASKSETASMNETVELLDSSFELESADTSKVDKKDKVKLYKCADCKVYFLTQRICYKHVIKHTALEAKDFIECKLCGYQFTIMALQTHIKKHHTNEFNLEEVLVEEYQPNVLENNVPKIEIYYAIDKDQSRLVSTTTDVKNVSENHLTKTTDVNESSEVTSNSNELTEKIDIKM